MKIESIGAPSAPQVTGAKAEVPVTARERAIQALMKPAQQEQPIVNNPNKVSPEELGAIRPSSSEKGQNYTSESPSEPAAEPAAPEEPLSSHYAVLARKEKAIRQREQQLKAREAALTAKEAPKAEPAKTFDESKYVARDRLTQDPFTVLNELGLTYDQLTELAINAPKPEQMALSNELRALKAEIQSLKGETENNKKSFEDREKQQYSQAMNQIRNEARNLIKSDPQFETIQATNSLGDVVELIERTFNEDGILMSVEEAAQQVESYLVDEAIRISRLKKIQQRLAPKAPAEGQKLTEQSEKQPLKTLTNAISSSRQMSARERAIAAMEGKLSK